jgi:hypothetical protein
MGTFLTTKKQVSILLGNGPWRVDDFRFDEVDSVLEILLLVQMGLDDGW